MISIQSTVIIPPTKASIRPVLEYVTDKADTGSSIDICKSDIDPEDTFPEGGRRAWLVVAGAWLFLFPSFGLEVCVGTITDYLQKHQLLGFSSSAIGWIPSVFVYLSLALGIWIGPIFDLHGSRALAWGGCVGHIILTFALGECQQYWQFMLCFSGLGISTAMLTTTSLACVAHWFKEHRGRAQGIAMVGPSFGGLSIPLILRETLPRYGYCWSMRILSFVFLGCLLLGIVLIRPRIPPSGVAKKRALVNLGIFSDPRVSLTTVSMFCFELVLFGVLTIIPTYAVTTPGYTDGTGFCLIAVLNGGSSIGRLIAGQVSDKFGRFNTLLVSAAIALLTMVAVWLPFGQRSIAALYVFTAMFGFMTGCWMALIPVCIGQLCRADEFGRYWGSMYCLASIASLLSAPVSGELVSLTSGSQILVLFYSIFLTLGIATFIASRWACLDWKWDWETRI